VNPSKGKKAGINLKIFAYWNLDFDDENKM
jgi:hypothetical protein